MNLRINMSKVNLHIAILGILFTVGTIGHIIPTTYKLMINITSAFLLIISAYSIYFSLKPINKPFEARKKEFASYRWGKRKLVLWITIAYSFTFLMEYLGANFGIVFGNYEYSRVLGASIGNVPLIIGLNWVIVTLGAYSISLRILSTIKTKINPQMKKKSLIHKRILLSIMTATLATSFDYVLEPIALKFNYWQWSGEEIPLFNYISWFIISFIITLFIPKNMIENQKNKYYLPLLEALFVIETFFFLSLSLALD